MVDEQEDLAEVGGVGEPSEKVPEPGFGFLVGGGGSVLEDEGEAVFLG